MAEGDELDKAVGEALDREKKRRGIWLEVAAVQHDSEAGCTAQLKGDREDKEPVWWPVDPTKVEDTTGFETYKAILGELDKKRLVLAKLSCTAANQLRCTVLRFRSPEAGGR
jgi:hypothetical protein